MKTLKNVDDFSKNYFPSETWLQMTLVEVCHHSVFVFYYNSIFLDFSIVFGLRLVWGSFFSPLQWLNIFKRSGKLDGVSGMKAWKTQRKVKRPRHLPTLSPIRPKRRTEQSIRQSIRPDRLGSFAHLLAKPCLALLCSFLRL